ncbi:MAG TPA: S53 family peptidase, partial [Planctomycetaceae bacterium]
MAAEIQLLEVRALLSANPAQVATIDLVRYHSGTVTPNVTSTQPPPGYTPAQIKQAYGFNQISFNGTAADGSGTTIAIVDAYDDPNIASDLHQFDLAFGLPDPTFIKVNQNGSTSSLPAANAGWITEIALDVEWAHAIAPGAKILLVEAKSNSDSDLYTAVNTARNYAGVDVVSMSWGGNEYSGERGDDSYFTTPAGHNGVTFLASSGDSGAPISSPGSSPNVVSVGGTTLSLGSNGAWTSESGWSGSGGGISKYEAQPSYQKGIVTQTTTLRANPDVAYDSDPNTGFGVYDSYNNGTSRPWGQWGGTSDAAPQWAALIAIADQGRALAGKSSLDGATQTLPLLYGMSANDFHDITSGTSTGSPHYSAGPGYDLVTGRGTPYANLVVSDLIGIVPPPVIPAPTLTSVSTLGVAFQQVPFAISYATLLGASNAQDYNGAPLQFRINSVQSGTLTLTHNGVTTAVVSGTSLLGPGDSLMWTSAAGVSGGAVSAFTVTAFDGSLASSPAVQVKISVQALGTAFNLSGPWIVDSAAGVAQGLGNVAQSGANLTFVNYNGASSSGRYTSQNQVVVTNFDNQASVAGTIDTTAADDGRIVFADGTVWLRVTLGGQYSVAGTGINSPTLASVTQNGINLTLVSGGTSTAATIASATQLLVTTGGNQTSAASYGDGQISFTYNGQVWTKLDLPVNFTSSLGGQTQVIQNGTTSLVFVNNQGQPSPGYWTSPTQVIATGFGNQTGTFNNGQLIWSTGEIWTENLALQG